MRSRTRLNDAQITRTAVRRSGFSLLEILFVLAVFVMISAMAVPMLLRSFTGQQLRGGADVVRARLAQARVRAIETGDIYGFFYTSGTGSYTLAPMQLGFASIMQGRKLTTEQDELENGIVFVIGKAVEDSRSIAQLGQSGQDASALQPVLFYPDGTSQDATLILQHKNGSLIQVSLRGLTGTSTTSRILSAQEALN